MDYFSNVHANSGRQAPNEDQLNPYELQDIPTGKVQAHPLPANPFDDPFSSPAASRDSLALDNNPFDDLKHPVRPKLATLNSTGALIAARRNITRYPSPARAYRRDIEIQQTVDKRKARSCRGWRMWLVIFLMLFLPFLLMLSVAVGEMERIRTLWPYVEAGKCKVFGGLSAARWRCEGIDGLID